MRRLSLTVLALVASLSGCSKHATDTTGPPPAPPVPELVAMQPPARTLSALYDSDIWGQFDRALDPHTVSTLTVYLKLDAQRIPITVSYDAASHRVTLKPTVVLELQRTYTVEFSTSVKGTDGTPLAPGVFFQFTTNSLRRPTYDYPLTSSLEGPVATLGWGGTLGPTNNLFYEVYVSTDSNAVKTRTAPMLARSVFTRYVPAVGWPLGTTVYWAVTSENLVTNERLDGSLRSFQTLDPSTPLDSVTITTLDHGSKAAGNTPQSCNTASFSCGAPFNGALHWGLSALPANARLQGVTVQLTVWGADTSTIQGTSPSLWMAQNEWSPCTVNFPGPPFNELSGLLAEATPQTNRVGTFTSDRLAAFFEALYRGRTLLYGTVVRASHAVTWHSERSDEVPSRPTAVIRFYRVPAAPSP